VNGVSGSFRPTVEPLSAFAGLSAASAWTLEVSDAAPGASGTLDYYCMDLTSPTPCYADCDHSGSLNVQDFSCFLHAVAYGQTYANCDQSTVAPVVNVADFSCFLNEFASCCAQ
jgi:hypothetical protein